MKPESQSGIDHAEVVLPCPDVLAMLAFFDPLGFRLESMFTADDPRVAVVTGHGLRLRLERSSARSDVSLRLTCANPSRVAGGETILTAPNGTRVELVESRTEIELPANDPAFALTNADDTATWIEGRAGMRYRDLIPQRQGGRFAASHIRIDEGGPVADYVHYHSVRFQMIYCYRGWVKVVYEDQGEPFVLHPGDCVLQPPRIRHRVLECSDGLEVIEVSCPAGHETASDFDLELPTDAVRSEREFDGQRFTRHTAEEATWFATGSNRYAGFAMRDCGIDAATGGLAGARVYLHGDAAAHAAATMQSVEAEFLFVFVLNGSASLAVDGDDGETMRLNAGDGFTMPSERMHRITDCSNDLELLEVSLPGAVSETIQ